MGFIIDQQEYSCILLYIPQEVLKKIKDKSITHSIFRIQDNESLRCVFYCITFIEYMLVGKTLLDYINLFSRNDNKKNDKIIYKSFKGKYGRRSKSQVKIKKKLMKQETIF